MAGSVHWPMAVYFDASVLCQLPPDLASPDLVRLNEAATKFDVGRFVPSIARMEWIFFHQEIARKRHEAMRSSSRLVGQYLDRVPLAIEEIRAADLARLVEHKQGARLAAAGLVEIPTPGVTVDELVNLAVKRIKPFKEGDKGFRDTLIVKTIAEHARRFEGQSIVVVSNDGDFSNTEVSRQWLDVGVQPLVARTIQEAVAQLEAAMDEAWKGYLDSEAQEIKKFLVSRQNEIFERLKDVEVSEGFIRGGGILGGMAAYIGTLERVRQARPLEITRVSRGHILGAHDKEGKRTPVTFYVKVAFDVTVSEYALSNILGGGPRFRLADAVDLRVPITAPVLSGATERELSIEREIPVEAWIAEDEKETYVELEIAKIRAW